MSNQDDQIDDDVTEEVEQLVAAEESPSVAAAATDLTMSIYELVRKGYGDYQQFVNDGKFVPGIDGLKTSYRRYLYSVRDIAKSKFTKSAMVLGNAMKWHPHEYQDDVLYSLVRWGLVTGQGNFGDTTMYSKIPSAAIRYTEVKYNNRIDSMLFKFENYFLQDEGENGFPEPKFLITPVPIALLRGTIGIGVGGVRTKIPAFTYESILKAYEKDDPSLLRSAYGLEIDQEKSNLKSLWEVGHGTLLLKFDYRKRNDGSVELFGDCTIARPNIKKLRKWEKLGYLTISNESTDMMKLVFTRVKGIRKISDKDILEAVKEATLIDGPRSTYIIMFSHNGQAIKMGIKGWLDLMMKMYRSTFEKWQMMEVSKLEKAIIKLELIPEVAKRINEGKTTIQIGQELNRSTKYIASIEQLPIKLLRRKDFSDSIKLQRDKIADIKKTTVTELIQSGSIVDSLLNAH